MSDGNFNRALLPHTPYASGLRMGKQLAIKHAKEAFITLINSRFPLLTEDEKTELLKEFSECLTY